MIYLYTYIIGGYEYGLQLYGANENSFGHTGLKVTGDWKAIACHRRCNQIDHWGMFKG